MTELGIVTDPEAFREAGRAWHASYALDVTDFVREGENRLEICVTSNLANRLIGDLRRPPAERTTWALREHYEKDAPLPSSGLIGAGAATR